MFFLKEQDLSLIHICGTLGGVGKGLKERNPDVQIIAIEPWGSQVLKGEPAGFHAIQGIGANFIPAVLDLEIIDEIIPVTVSYTHLVLDDTFNKKPQVFSSLGAQFITSYVILQSYFFINYLTFKYV